MCCGTLSVTYVSSRAKASMETTKAFIKKPYCEGKNAGADSASLRTGLESLILVGRGERGQGRLCVCLGDVFCATGIISFLSLLLSFYFLTCTLYATVCGAHETGARESGGRGSCCVPSVSFLCLLLVGIFPPDLSLGSLVQMVHGRSVSFAFLLM